MNKDEVSFLVCDDSILARKSMKDALISLGYSNISEASNGQLAVNLCKENTPTVVFLDIIMPVKDGITATQEIVENNKDIKVIMCSSVGTQTHLREAIKAGAKDFIQKPVDQAVLEQVLNHILG